jgi:uncharacterized repeat protein (TIGR03803 family)
MRSKKVSAGLIVALAIFTVTLLATSMRAAAQSEVVLHSFDISGTDGIEPVGNVIFAGATHLYGTTPSGGTSGRGTVFELAAKRGVWSEMIPHPFDFNYTDGTGPSSGVLLHVGKLYGTTQGGGTNGYGTVFELTYTAGTGWTQTFPYSFGAAPDGQYPSSGLIFANGDFYGTTSGGGASVACYNGTGCGTVFKLTPVTGGGWTETVVHSFGNGSDGQVPVGLLFHGGNLYGTTEDGGLNGEGMVFELNPKTGGEKDLHDFPPNNGTGTDGAIPYVGLTVDTAGDLYGTTSQGGTYNYGIAFKLTAKTWVETVLHDFDNNAVDGAFPSGLILDSSGNLYGTTLEGGANNSGIAFELVPGTPWTETILYSFCSSSSCTDGKFPSSGLTFDTTGNLYGTTQEGGAYGWGTVFGIILHSFTLSASPSALTVAQGSSVTSTISVADINGFAGNVTLTASGLPKGVTASFSPPSTSSVSTLTLTASATAKITTANVTVTGTSGSLYQTASIKLTVIQ